MEWKEVKLGDVCTKIGSGATPSGGKEAYKGGKYHLVRSQNVLDFAFSWDGLADINDEQAKKLKNVELFNGDVLVNITGDSVARSCMIPKEVLPARVNQHVAILRSNPEKLDNFFLLYTLQKHKRQLLQLASAGATRNAITKKMLEDYVIKLPPLTTQRRIASILSSLDRKIELNNKINAQLEEMAQALFKSWFVDFEPFKDGKFVESEMGMIPEGWRVGTLGVIASVTKKSINPQKNPDIVYSHYSLPAYDEQRYPVRQSGAEIMSNKTIFEGKTTLLSKLNPHIKRVWFVNQVKKNPVCSTEFIPIKAHNDFYCSFVYCLINSDWFYGKAVSGVNGATTSHQRIHPEDIMGLRFAMHNDIMLKFCAKVYPMLCKIEQNIEENTQLSQLRDTLLPKLMNGEIEL